jgi:hypothetical protein
MSVLSTTQADAEPRRTPIGTMILAVIAPFATIGVMAAPLILDALRHATGL